MRTKVKAAGILLSAALCCSAFGPAKPAYANIDDYAEAGDVTGAADSADSDGGVVEPIPEGEVPAKQEQMGPLTPDGNLTLVDDYGSGATEGKQFITVTSKDGNYFYIIIDRDDHGEQTVHFLNLVDEEDLMALVDQDTADQMKSRKDAEEAARKAAEDAIRAQQERESQKETEKETEPEKKTNPAAAVIPILLLAGIGAGGAYLYLQNQKDNGKGQHPDPDDDYYLDDDDDDEFKAPEEEPQEAVEQEKAESRTYEGWGT